MDEQMIADIAKAIEQPFIPHGYELKPHLLTAAARAARGVIAGKVAELEGRIDAALAILHDFELPEIVRVYDARAALAPYPERRHD